MRGNDFSLYSVCTQLSLAHTEYARKFVYIAYTAGNDVYFTLSMHGFVFSLYSVCAEVHTEYMLNAILRLLSIK
jgi:hypothetical protein